MGLFLSLMRQQLLISVLSRSFIWFSNQVSKIVDYDNSLNFCIYFSFLLLFIPVRYHQFNKIRILRWARESCKENFSLESVTAGIGNEALFLSFLDYHLNSRKRWRTTCLLVASLVDAHTSRISPDDKHFNEGMRQKEMRMTDFAVLFSYCNSSVPCKGKIWSGIMWFSEWNYELVKSYSLFLVSIIDGSTRKDTRSLNPINNSVNE